MSFVLFFITFFEWLSDTEDLAKTLFRVIKLSKTNNQKQAHKLILLQEKLIKFSSFSNKKKVEWETEGNSQPSSTFFYASAISRGAIRPGDP